LSNSAPRILYVITDLKVGGVPLHLHRLAVNMRERGFQPTVASLAPSEPVADRLEAEGIPVRSCDACGRWDVRVFFRLKRIIRETRPNIIHSFLFHGNFAARFAARMAGFPRDRLLCEIQTVEVERRWHLTVDRWTHGMCRATIGNSPSVVEHLAVAARIPRDRLLLVRGGIDVERIRKARPIDRASFGISTKAPLILWVGRLDPVKGLEILIEAFRVVSDRTDAHLVLVGNGPLRASLCAQVARLGLDSRVHLIGARNDVPSLLAAANLFVFPSRTEGLPNALLEAMAAGLPIITTDAPGCRDLIAHGETGLLVPYGDTISLADSLLSLLRDREQAAKLGQRAHQAVLRDWHAESMYGAYQDVYRTISRTKPESNSGG